MEIIDAHVHIYPDKIALKASKAIGDFYGIPMDYDGTVNGLLEVGKKAGISRYLVHSVATTPHQVHSINTFILEQLKAHKEFIGFITLHPDLTIDEKSGFSILLATSFNDDAISIATSIIAPSAPINIPAKINAFKSIAEFFRYN